MILAFRNPCGRHRAALIDFVDRRELGSATAAALSHLDRCRACEEELSAIALTIAALRRLRRDVDGEEPAADAWLRLRARIQRPINPWAWRATLGGLVGSTLLVAVFVAPMTFGDVGRTAGPPPWVRWEMQIEAAYLASGRESGLPRTPRIQSGGGSFPRDYPDEIRQIRKEVPKAKPTIRPPESIGS
ncbi:MAG TPA: hypothetical protein VGQ58_07450 [Candidatus Limnocylindrales bacterium]|jgi:hypothetical protein|nr:hypothetical protein [Candidatus Limnocylindrales bacterium]